LIPSAPSRWIETAADLRRDAARWRAPAVAAIAFDTEFVRERTFYARLGLIQVADGAASYLVDTVALASREQLAPLGAVMTDPGVLKVVHSGSEDLEVLDRALGVLPEPLLDTQIAASIAGFTPPPGYQRLISSLLGVELHKLETRTDWTRRPLSAGQLEYAAEDVTHLLEAYGKLRADLETRGRWAWALEDSARLVEAARRGAGEPAERAYLRLRAAEAMDRRQLGALRSLAAWREEEARRRDLPRGFVVKDDLLTAMAQRRPRSLAELQALKPWDARTGPRHAATWLDLLRRAAELSESDLPPAIDKPSPADLTAAERLREVARQAATALGVAPEVLASKRTLLQIARRRGEPDAALEPLGGWRRGVLGDSFGRELALSQ
jgi:ribonuclease D